MRCDIAQALVLMLMSVSRDTAQTKAIFAFCSEEHGLGGGWWEICHPHLKRKEEKKAARDIKILICLKWS